MNAIAGRSGLKADLIGAAGPNCRAGALLSAVVLRTVSSTFGVPMDELTGKTRGRAPAAFARQVAMYLSHVVFGLTQSDVGRIYGRDRKTVSHACMIVEDRREDPDFDRSIELLESIAKVFADQVPPSYLHMREGL